MAFGTAPIELAEKIDPTGAWPYNSMPRQQDGEGGWTLWMSRGASVALWPNDAHPNPGEQRYIRVCACTEEQGRKFLTTFCMLGYETQEWLKHQEGRTHLFNWRSFNLAQLAIASQVAQRLFEGDWDGAWMIGKAYGDQIDKAVESYYVTGEIW